MRKGRGLLCNLLEIFAGYQGIIYLAIYLSFAKIKFLAIKGYPVCIFTLEDVGLARLDWIKKPFAMTFVRKKEE